jgi:histone acetyltransferase (RNA polymerase elongator complex component)
MICTEYFDQGPIRPPSEARSLLIRPTRNCPWNKCKFCHTYRGQKFQLRSVEDIKRDIDIVRSMANRIREFSIELGQGGNVNDNVLSYMFGQMQTQEWNDQFHHVAAWLYFGGKTVFLQDGDTLIMKTGDLLAVLQYLKDNFPDVNRITSYCRSRSASHKSVAELKELLSAGLNRLHIGLETGYDPLLKFINKGVTAADHIKGGCNVMESGIELSEFVMPGLGGAQWSRDHAVETARVLNEINPHFIRIRSFLVRTDTDMHDMTMTNEFAPMTEDKVVEEIRSFIEHLTGIESYVTSDHVLNLLEELEGKLPEEKEKLLAIIDRYLTLPEEDRMIFRMGRRLGYYRQLDDLRNEGRYNQIKSALERRKEQSPEELDRYITQISQRFLP